MHQRHRGQERTRRSPPARPPTEVGIEELRVRSVIASVQPWQSASSREDPEPMKLRGPLRLRRWVATGCGPSSAMEAGRVQGQLFPSHPHVSTEAPSSTAAQPAVSQLSGFRMRTSSPPSRKTSPKVAAVADGHVSRLIWFGCTAHVTTIAAATNEGRNFRSSRSSRRPAPKKSTDCTNALSSGESGERDRKRAHRQAGRRDAQPSVRRRPPPSSPRRPRLSPSTSHPAHTPRQLRDGQGEHRRRRPGGRPQRRSNAANGSTLAPSLESKSHHGPAAPPAEVTSPP